MTFQHLAWATAFGIALRLYTSNARRGRLRFVLALWCGVACARLGWALLHLPLVVREPSWLVQHGAVSVLFLPAGVLLVAPWREALTALPAALLVARLGCLPYGCCYESSWQAAPELLGLASMHLAARARPAGAALLVVSGLGALRLLSEPLRRQDPTVLIAPEWIAGLWLLGGAALRGRLASAQLAAPRASENGMALVRALLVMAGVWLLFSLVRETFPGSSRAFLAACLASALLLGLTRERGCRRLPPEGLASLAAGPVACLLALELLAGEVLRVHEPPWLVSVLVLAPIFEELLYRDRLLGALRPILGGAGAVLVSSVLFAASHRDPAAMPGPLVLGLVSGALVLRTGSLPFAVGLHSTANAGVLLVQVS